MSDQGGRQKPPVGTGDRRLDERVPTQVRVRMKYPDVETFLERYATNISRGGIFIQTQRTKPAGTLIRFEFQLQDASPVIRGEGRVSWVVPYDPAHAERAYGMGVKFTKLDGRSKTYIDRVVAQKLKRGQPDDASAPPSPEVAELGPVRDVSPQESAGASGRTPPKASPIAPTSGGPRPPLAEGKRPRNGQPTDEEIAELLATPLTMEPAALVAKVLGKPKIEPAAADEILAELEREVGPISSSPRAGPPRGAAAPRASVPPAQAAEAQADQEPAPQPVAPARVAHEPAPRPATPAPTGPAPLRITPAPTAPASTPRPWVRRTPPQRAPVAAVEQAGREPTPTPVVDPTEAVIAPPDTGRGARSDSRLDRLLEEAVPEGSFELDLDGLGAGEDTGLDIPVPRAEPREPERPPSPAPSPRAGGAPATSGAERQARPGAGAPETIPSSVPVATSAESSEPLGGAAEPAAEATDPALALPATERDMPLVGGDDSAWDQITVVPNGNEPEITPREDRQLAARAPLAVTAPDPAIHVADLGGDDPAFSMDDAPLIEEGEGGLSERTVIGGSIFDFLSPTGKARADDAIQRSALDRNLEVTATHPPLEVPDSEAPSPDSGSDAIFGVEVELPPDAGAQQGLPILDEPLVDDFGLPPEGPAEPLAAEAGAAVAGEPIVDDDAEAGEPLPSGGTEIGMGQAYPEIEIGLEPTAAQDVLLDDLGNEATTAAPVLQDAFVYAQTIQAEALASDAFEPTLAREPALEDADDRAQGHDPFPAPALEEGTLRDAALPETPEEQTPIAPNDPTPGPDAQKKGFFRKLFGNK